MAWNNNNRPNPYDKFLGPEDIIHVQVCVWAILEFPGIKIHHSPNEGRRTPFERYKLKKLNVSPGFVDLFLVYKGKVIALELKAGINKPTPFQRSWLAALNAAGIPADWQSTFEGAQFFINHHFGPLKRLNV